MTIAIRQQAWNDPSGSGTSGTVQVGVNNPTGTTGNTLAGSILVAFAWSNFTTITGMSSAQMGTMTQIVSQSADSGNRHAYAYYVANITGGTEDTITASYAASAGEHPMAVIEISGAATSSVLTGTPNSADQTSPGTGAGAVSPGSLTPAVQPALIVAIAMSLTFNQTTFTATSPYSAQSLVWGGTSGGNALISSNRVTSVSASTPTFTIGSNTEVPSLVMAFAEATASARLLLLNSSGGF
jgi:hypothetical protein